MKVPPKKIVSILFAVLVLLRLLRTYHEIYLLRSETHRKAKLYMMSDVCTKAELKAELGDWHKCAESRAQLEIPVYLAAFYGTLEGYSICGASRCQDIVDWIIWNKFWIALITVGGTFLAYQVLMYNLRVKQMDMMTQLSLPHRRLHND